MIAAQQATADTSSSNTQEISRTQDGNGYIPLRICAASSIFANSESGSLDFFRISSSWHDLDDESSASFSLISGSCALRNVKVSEALGDLAELLSLGFVFLN